MTDFAKRATPGEALREFAKEIHWMAEDHRRQAREHVLMADALDRQWHEAEKTASDYDKWQPKDEPDGGDTSHEEGDG